MERRNNVSVELKKKFDRSKIISVKTKIDVAQVRVIYCIDYDEWSIGTLIIFYLLYS